uniref:propionyl-CoA synthetase n=1 Tax=Ningiella ruwaisensis TaxID=2364274 RepID=UPI00109F9303|nr:propionyl-CoA synthetase [Ningiella ruwaisensis]
MSYQKEYNASIQNPVKFWADKAKALSWYKSPQTILSQDENGADRWFADARLNTSYLALDYHVEQGRGNKTALIYDSPVSASKERYSYQELRDQVALFAQVLANQHVGKGDTVVIYMPMIPQALIAMLAVARLGAIHSVVFGGFAANELAVRIDDAKPKVLITASCGIEVSKIIAYKPMVDAAISQAKHSVENIICVQREQGPAKLDGEFELDYHEQMAFVERSGQKADPVEIQGSDPLYILYTSGTTGKPKGVVRDNASHAVALKYSMSAVYDISQDDVFWAASDVGWVVGHSYIVYAPLIHGCTTILYEGKPVRTPDSGAFWRVVEEYGVTALFAAPTAFRAIRKEDPEAKELAKYDLSSLRTIFMAGERLDPPTYEWTHKHTKKPVIDHWWQTETGWAICANCLGLEAMSVKPGSATVPVPGFNIQILNSMGESLGANVQGSIAIKRPLPPGCLPTIWGDFERFKQSYLSEYPGFYTSGDGGYIDEDGYLFIMGRTDDVINVAGHRLSTGEMEEVIASHDAVAECAVIGIHDPLKGQVPIGLALLKDGVDITEERLQDELVAMVRHSIGAVACLKRTMIVSRLPKTRSGKILRKLLRQIADDEVLNIPSTIDDPQSVDEIRSVIKHNGLLKTKVNEAV